MHTDHIISPPDGYERISDFADQENVSKSQVYEAVKAEMQHLRTITINRRRYYPRDGLAEALRRHTATGLRYLPSCLAHFGAGNIRAVSGYGGRVWATRDAEILTSEGAVCRTFRRADDRRTLVAIPGHDPVYRSRLVCLAFHGRPRRRASEVDHVDGDSNNDTASNLDWVSRAENNRRAQRRLKTSNRTPYKFTGSMLEKLKSSFRAHRSFDDFLRDTDTLRSEISSASYYRLRRQYFDEETKKAKERTKSPSQVKYDGTNPFLLAAYEDAA